MDPKLIRKGYLKEVAFFEKQAGRLPNKKSAPKYENIGAVWVISGGGSYLSAIIDTPSDHAYGEKKWYPNQDKRRLDYAKAVLDSLSHLMPKSKPTLIYNGTRKQNLDLRKAISQGLFKFPMSRLYIAPGKITKTLEQVKKFTFPPGFRPEKMKLGLLSHSVHLPRVLRFMNRHSKKFKAVRIIPFSLNLPEKALERQMADCELETLLGYISRDEASIEPYPFEKNGSEEVRVSVMRREDSKDVLALSNQKSVRRASFNPKKIELSEHEKWLKAKLKDKNCIFLKAVLEGKFVGQVRLDIDKDKTAVIGVSVSGKFRGRGIASMLLRNAITEAKKRGLKAIKAYIKPENIVSIGLFKKSGFVYNGETQVSGSPARRYLYKL